MRGTRYPNAEEHPPLPPFKGGKERSEGGMLSLQRGECGSEALGKQTERKFRKWRKLTRITVFVILNARLCHSERSEESRLERLRRSSMGLGR